MAKKTNKKKAIANVTDIPEEEIVESEQIFDGKIVHLQVNTVEVGDGNQYTRELVVHDGAVALVPIDADGNVYLVRQYRGGAKQILLELPAGTVEPGEERIITARRELQEEIGFYPGKLTTLGDFYVAASYTTERITIFLAEDLSASELNADDDEFIAIEKMPFDDALKLAFTNNIIDSKTLIGLTWAAYQMGKLKVPVLDE